MIRVNVRGNGVVSGVTARQYALALVAVRYARYVAVRFSPKHHESSTHTHTHISVNDIDRTSKIYFPRDYDSTYRNSCP